jgi:hypothetical protein
MHEKKIPAIFSGAEKKETKKISSDFKWNKEIFFVPVSFPPLFPHF